MSRKYRVGILSDSPMLCTGYSNQARVIANVLSDAGHEVFYYANAYIGQTIMPGLKMEDNFTFNFKIYGGGREQYFKDLLPIYTKQHKLDVLIILLDTFMLYPWITQLDLSPAKKVFYFPSDGGGGLPLNCEHVLNYMDLPVAMAQFGQAQVKKVHGINAHHIPHAVDTKNYYPLPEKKRQELRKKWGVEDKFVIGVVARNQGRKMLDRTLKAMAIYAKENPNAVLLMHCDPDDGAQVFPLGSLITRYGLQNRVIFTGTKYYKGFDYKDMNNVYNVMDVFLLTTSGEGFGIPIVEAMACEIPVVATNYTTTKELVLDNNAGLGIALVGETDQSSEAICIHGPEITDGTLTGSWAVERGMCSIYDTSKKLKIIESNPKEAKEMGKNGRKAVLKKYNWNVCGPSWIDLVEKLGGQY